MENKEDRKKRLRQERETSLKQKRFDEAPIVECACGCGETFKQLMTNAGTPKIFIAGHNSRNMARERRKRIKDSELTQEQLEIRNKKEANYLKKWQEAPYIKCACGCGEELKEYDKYGRKLKYINGHNNRKFDDPKQFIKNYYARNKRKYKQAKKLKIRQNRVELLLYKGGKCSICGLEYDGTNAPMFDLHHRIPTEKEFNLGYTTFDRKKLEDIYKEAEKCDMVCSNCHRLLHNDKY